MFAPHNFIDLTANQTFDFTGLRRLVLSGRVKDRNGAGLIGITVTLSGTESGSTITAADGSYSLIATATGNYTVTPSIGQNWYCFCSRDRAVQQPGRCSNSRLYRNSRAHS